LWVQLSKYDTSRIDDAVAFGATTHQAVQSQDGSFTAYSNEFNEHYHSTKDGALQESLQKHVIPALLHHRDKDELTILDICFGLGFNTLATLYYMRKNGMKKKLSIYSPEFDKKLISSLKEFPYPDIFAEFKDIIHALSQHAEYQDDTLYIKIYLGDAREFLAGCEKRFDIVYQDAFSPAANPALWTQEYFKDIKRVIKEDAILTTYSISLPTRLALFYNGFHIYLIDTKTCRSSTIASPTLLQNYKKIDMEHKIACNPDAKALSDKQLA
jgi:tRNA U34 5-methylaminomethyl-2-thiouridine-forming methyltransferase MnmC